MTTSFADIPTTHGLQVYMCAWQRCCAECRILPISAFHFNFPFQLSVFRFSFPFQFSVSAFHFSFQFPLFPLAPFLPIQIVCVTHSTPKGWDINAFVFTVTKQAPIYTIPFLLSAIRLIWSEGGYHYWCNSVHFGSSSADWSLLPLVRNACMHT